MQDHRRDARPSPPASPKHNNEYNMITAAIQQPPIRLNTPCRLHTVRIENISPTSRRGSRDWRGEKQEDATTQVASYGNPSHHGPEPHRIAAARSWAL